MTNTSIPAGYRQDDKGRLVPESQIKEIDLLKDDVVAKIIDSAKTISNSISEFRKKAEAEIQTFLQLAAEKHGVVINPPKGNITLKTFDGKRKIRLDSGSRIAFNENIHIAKELIDECICEWSQGVNANLRTLINQAFELDQSGKMDVKAILKLGKLNIESEKWEKAVSLIRESVTSESTKNYLRCYEADPASEEVKLIPLDIASL